MSFNKPFSQLSRKQQNRIAKRQIDEESEIDSSSSSDNEAEAEVSENSNGLDEISHNLSHNEHEIQIMESDNESDVALFSDDEIVDEDTDEDEEYEGTALLRDFCMRHLPADSAVNELLKILRVIKHPERLPKNHDELYFTSEAPMPEPISIGGGHYLHFGIKANLKYVEIDNPQLEILTLNFSWDGVRLFKSSNTTLWPIVMDIEELPDVDVMLVGLFIGESKPKNPNEFFHCFNEECNDIKNSDFIVNVGLSKKPVKVRSDFCTADVPARLWALCKYKNKFNMSFFIFMNCVRSTN